ncbi:MAG: helix-turn-helix domain-containing protein [Firmicutes bacterium]|nr:helix-turn-helix domain-containing protein [Bacillota bacterium]
MDPGELLRRPEGKTVEFKRDLSSPEGILRTLVAFANTAGGTLLIGVEDRTRRIVGVADPFGLEERLASMIADRIRPRLVPDLEILPWRRTHLVAVRVYPSPVRPHYLVDLGFEDGVFVRVGSTNRRADPPLVAELRRYVLGRSFDEEALPDLGPDSLDVEAAVRAFAPARELRREDLRTLGMLTEYQGRTVPTVGGVLLFGKERHRHFPDAWIQAGRFEGTDRRRLVDSAEIRSHLSFAVEEAFAFVQRNIAREAVIKGMRRVERWAFPLVAVREALVNAVVHADYTQTGAPIRVAVFDDRLEVENPGILPFGLTIEDIRRGISKLRNRVIGRVFHALGLIEQWGSGIQRMVAACEEAGLAPPILEEIGIHFRATLSAGRQRPPALDEVDRAIVAALRGGRGLSTQAVAERIGRSTRATRSRLLRLVQRGVVVEVGTGPTDPRRRYFLSEEPRR